MNVVVLKDDTHRPVIRIDNGVHRNTGWWSPAVHQLLRYLEGTGFPYTPRVLGVDPDGREILSYIQGDTGQPVWAALASEQGVAKFARLLRAYHDAVRPFPAPAGTVWAHSKRPLAPGEIICHGDFGPWNTVWRHGEPAAILDWDFAGPGQPMDDVAYALHAVVPFRDDHAATQQFGWTQIPNRRSRVAAFLRGYGWVSVPGIASHVVGRQRLSIARIRELAQRGLQPQATWVEQGFLDELERRTTWIERNQALFE